jgi:hypothetical protein
VDLLHLVGPDDEPVVVSLAASWVDGDAGADTDTGATSPRSFPFPCPWYCGRE